MNNKTYVDNLYALTARSDYSKQNHAQERPTQIYTFYPNQNVANSQDPSNLIRNKNNIYPSTCEVPYFDNRLGEGEKNFRKPTDRSEMIEISAKDLSPASLCSNLDMFGTDFFKTISKDIAYYNKYESQWYSSNFNLKNDLPSCAQVNQSFDIDQNAKYCSIQKNQEVETANKSYLSGHNYLYSETNQISLKNADKPQFNDSVLNDCSYYNYYEVRQVDSSNIQNACFGLNTDVTLIPNSLPFESITATDQHTECSNEESDIIVEDSDEDINTDCSEDQERKMHYLSNKCMICNQSYIPIGLQFYCLTLDSPVTMTSQKPVFEEIKKILGSISTTCNYLCSECLGLVNSIDHLQLKLESFRNELKNKFSKTCNSNNITVDKSFPVKSTRIMKQLPKYRCKYCKMVLSLKQYCENHIKKHKRKKFLCDICGRLCQNSVKFSKHIKLHGSKNIPKMNSYLCSNCDKTFRTRSNLKEHQHYCLGTLPYKCKNQYCDKKFASSSKLKNHVKLKHDKKFIAICSICNIGFIKLSDYKSHMITHSTEKKHECMKCDKSYKTLSNLNFHLKSHEKNLPFNCTICAKGFLRKEYFEAHMNNHNGIKSFGCSICLKKFVSQKNLDSHSKYHDGSIKKRTCNICGKSLTTSFQEHLRIHNNLKEFECNLCESKFNTKGTLAKHKKKKHKGKFIANGSPVDIEKGNSNL